MAENDVVGMTAHGTPEEALRAVHRALQEAGEDGKWMAAVWSVSNDQLRLLTRTTWQFPVGDAGEALEQVRRTFAVEQPTTQTLRVTPMPPLQAATFRTGSRLPLTGDGDDD